MLTDRLGGGTVYGGGYWTCDKCGRTISGSSIHHNCSGINPLIKQSRMARTRKYRKKKIARIFLVI